MMFLGLDFANLTLRNAASWLAARPYGARMWYVVTPNADHLVRVSRDPDLWAIYNNAALCVLDSRVVARLARLVGIRPPPVCPGSDLTEELLRRHLQPGERVTIIGMEPKWVAELVRRLGMAQPAHFNPPMGFDRDPKAFAEAVAFIVDNPARFVFLAVGAPRQERLAAAAKQAGAKGTAICAGASLDFLAGKQRRAPRLMQQLGLEWLFRLATQPRRMFRRYLIDSPAVIGLLLKQRFARRSPVAAE